MAGKTLPTPTTVASYLFLDKFLKYPEVAKQIIRHIEMFSTSECGGREKVLMSFNFLEQIFDNLAQEGREA